MKRIEVYSKAYKWKDIEGSHGFIRRTENPADDINKRLSEICFHIGNDYNLTAKSIEKQKYLFYEMQTSILPTPLMTDKNCQCFISVDKDSFNKETPEDNYARRVSIEIMPEHAKTPKELSDLLISRGFIDI